MKQWEAGLYKLNKNSMGGGKKYYSLQWHNLFVIRKNN